MRKQRVEKAKSLSRQWKMFASPSGLDGKIKNLFLPKRLICVKLLFTESSSVTAGWRAYLRKRYSGLKSLQVVRGNI